MSYRLVDANELALVIPEVNTMPCIYADLPNGLDNGHYDLSSGHNEKEMPWYLSIFNTELLKQKGHWITDDAWSDIAYNTEFLEFLYNHINPNDMEHYRQMFEMKDAVAVNGAEKESSNERDSD